MSGEKESRTLEVDLARATNAARAVLRRKLGVSLRPDDGRTENQDALELLSDIQFRLLRKLQSPDELSETPDVGGIRNLDSYTRQVARNTCSEYLRDRFPLRALLKNRLRRFFRKRQGYAEWELEGELVCGFAGWRNRREYVPEATRIARAVADPAGIAPAARPRAAFDQLRVADWEALLEPVLNDLGCALELDDLVSILAPRLGVKDISIETGKPAEDESGPLDTAAVLEPLQKAAGPDAELYLRELLGGLWQGLLRMDARKRCAFLLNPPNMEAELFPVYGVARIRDIGRALALTDAQFDVLWDGLPLAEDARAFARLQEGPEAKFAIVWSYLPLQDALIGKLLGLTQQQVINQRMLARRVLSRELAPFLSPGKR